MTRESKSCKKTDVGLAVADISATAAALRAMPEVTGKIAAIGYCFRRPPRAI